MAASLTRCALRATLLGALLGLGPAGCRCGVDDSAEQEAAPEPAERSEPANPYAERGEPEPRRRLVIADAEQLDEVDLSRVQELDLALSELDGQERPLPLSEDDEDDGEDDDASEGDSGVAEEAALATGTLGTTGSASPPPEDPEAVQARIHPRCEGLDLHELAANAPRLRSLRISGCQAAVHSGLSAFGERLEELELVDLELDAVTVARLAQLHGLDKLTLTRVTAEPDALKPLGRKISPSTVVLRELERDSPVSEILMILRGLEHVRLEGAWVEHTAMIRLGKVRGLETLALIDTPIGNFSLHQIKTLDHLHRIEWRGSGFSDVSPQYLRDLPLDELICNCPRFGDRGLKMLRYLEGLRVLELERSEISSAGLAHLVELQLLEDVTIRYRELDGDAFAAFSTLPQLRRLILGPGELTDPKAENLGLLLELRELELDLEGFGDRAAPQLATLIELERLALGGTDISDEGLEHLANLTKLRVLELHHTRVTKHGLEHLAGMQRLEVLELDHTDVVDEGVAHLAKLKSLRDLRLDNTLITDAALPHLLELENLERLNLANTVVTAKGVEVLAGLPKLEAVNLEGTRALGE